MRRLAERIQGLEGVHPRPDNGAFLPICRDTARITPGRRCDSSTKTLDTGHGGV